MRVFNRSSRAAGRMIAQMGVLGLLAVGAVGVTATAPALASGTSDTMFNCYTQWWNTAWAQKCPNGATWSGVYVSGVSCSGVDSDGYMEIARAQGSTAVYSGDDCIYSASDGWMSYYN